MQAIDSGRVAPSERIQHHLDLCLDCRACETVCPSGVQYGRLIESYRTTVILPKPFQRGAIRPVEEEINLLTYWTIRRWENEN